jgi:hypothetical protein
MPDHVSNLMPYHRFTTTMTTTTMASIGGDSIPQNKIGTMILLPSRPPTCSHRNVPPKKERPGEWNQKQRNMDEMSLLL